MFTFQKYRIFTTFLSNYKKKNKYNKVLITSESSNSIEIFVCSFVLNQSSCVSFITTESQVFFNNARERFAWYLHFTRQDFLFLQRISSDSCLHDFDGSRCMNSAWPARSFSVLYSASILKQPYSTIDKLSCDSKWSPLSSYTYEVQQ